MDNCNIMNSNLLLKSYSRIAASWYKNMARKPRNNRVPSGDGLLGRVDPGDFPGRQQPTATNDHVTVARED